MNNLDPQLQSLLLKKMQNCPPANYTNFVRWEGKNVFYMSETDPHFDYPVSEERTWDITFLWLEKGYRFIYTLDGIEHNITPELNKPYKFNFEVKHALIKEYHADKFDDEKYWDRDDILDNNLCVIFTLD